MGFASSEQQVFVNSFRDAFAARLASEHDLLSRYSGSGWTRVMLGGANEPDGILQTAADSYAKKIGEDCTPHTQWYTLDLSLVSPPCKGATEYWQTRTVLAIEHENGDDVETEMWKLAHWSAKLTVCVFYDFNETKLDGTIYNGDRSLPHVARRDWLARKLSLLSDIVRHVDYERAKRHLLIIGNRTSDDHVRWRYSAWESDAFAAPSLIL